MQKEKFISWIAAWFFRAAGRTLRIRVIDHAGFFSGARPAPVIFAFWHNRMLAVLAAYLRYYRKLVRSGQRKGTVVLISRNRDARLISNVVARFGVGVVSGSSTLGGPAAFLELTKCINDGVDVHITPDGPRGPCYKLGYGVVVLSQKTGAPILPVHVEFSHCIRFNSWDRFMVPLPFSRINMTFGKLEFVAATGTEEEFEAERMRLEKLMQPQTR